MPRQYEELSRILSKSISMLLDFPLFFRMALRTRRKRYRIMTNPQNIPTKNIATALTHFRQTPAGGFACRGIHLAQSNCQRIHHFLLQASVTLPSERKAKAGRSRGALDKGLWYWTRHAVVPCFCDHRRPSRIIDSITHSTYRAGLTFPFENSPEVSFKYSSALQSFPMQMRDPLFKEVFPGAQTSQPDASGRSCDRQEGQSCTEFAHLILGSAQENIVYIALTVESLRTFLSRQISQAVEASNAVIPNRDNLCK